MQTVSDSGSSDDATPDPFRGLPIFGDLAKMFQQQGTMSWDAARQFALSIATGGQPEGNVDPLERIRIEQLARVAELQIANATGLDPAPGGRGLTRGAGQPHAVGPAAPSTPTGRCSRCWPRSLNARAADDADRGPTRPTRWASWPRC